MSRPVNRPVTRAPRRARSRRRSPIAPVVSTAPITPKRRRFLVGLLVEIEIDEQLLAGVLTDEWRDRFYQLWTAEDVAGHLAYNLAQDRRLSSLDGFADQDEDRARVLHIEVDEDDGILEIPPEEPAPPRPPPSSPRRAPARPARPVEGAGTTPRGRSRAPRPRRRSPPGGAP